MSGTNLITLVVGVIALLAGRRLFWLFVTAVGFFTGLEIAGPLLPGQPEIFRLAIAVVAGLMGAALAYYLEWLAIAAVGFLVGGRIATAIVIAIGLGTQIMPWLAFIIGGAIGTILMVMVFDWALIALSSLFGAALLAQVAATASGLNPSVLFVALWVLGFLVQAALLRRW